MWAGVSSHPVDQQPQYQKMVVTCNRLTSDDNSQRFRSKTPMLWEVCEN